MLFDHKGNNSKMGDNSDQKKVNFAQISCGASLGWGNERYLLKWSQSVDQDGRHAYMVKTFENLQNRGCLVAESLHKSSGTGGLPKLLK